MRRAIIIMPATKCEAANQWLVDNFDPAAGATFLPSIGVDENAPPTHAMCDWLLRDEDYDKVVAEFASGYGAQLAEGMPYLDRPTEGRTRGRDFMEANGLKRRKHADR